jgi:hypothetical protein
VINNTLDAAQSPWVASGETVIYAPQVATDFAGIPIYDNFLSIPDMLNDPDVLQWSLAQQASLTLQYGFSSSIGTQPTSWADWAPGSQVVQAPGTYLWWRIAMQTTSPFVQPQLSKLDISLYAVERVRKGYNLASSSVLSPSGAQVLQTTEFAGFADPVTGEPTSTAPQLLLEWLDLQSGDSVTVGWYQHPGAFYYDGFSVIVQNGGSAVVRHYNYTLIAY